jgi:hypothetical protein
VVLVTVWLSEKQSSTIPSTLRQSASELSEVGGRKGQIQKNHNWNLVLNVKIGFLAFESVVVLRRARWNCKEEMANSPSFACACCRMIADAAV